MKKLSRRALSLCLVAVLAAGLLMLPASADEEAEDGEIIIVEGGEPILCTMDPDTKCVTAGAWTWDLSLLDEATKDMSREEKSDLEASIESLLQMDAALSTLEDLQAAEAAAQTTGACDNPNHPKTYKTTYEYTNSSESSHWVRAIECELCSICFTKKFITSEGHFEDHTFGPGRYITSSHGGVPSSHTLTYEYTCVSCRHIKQETVPAGCREGSCVSPQSVADPSPES